jgi:hypothetical protein
VAQAPDAAILIVPDPADDRQLFKDLPRKFLILGAIVIALIILAMITH